MLDPERRRVDGRLARRAIAVREGVRVDERNGPRAVRGGHVVDRHERGRFRRPAAGVEERTDLAPGHGRAAG